jgi:hypothetical protein
MRRCCRSFSRSLGGARSRPSHRLAAAVPEQATGARPASGADKATGPSLAVTGRLWDSATALEGFRVFRQADRFTQGDVPCDRGWLE